MQVRAYNIMSRKKQSSGGSNFLAGLVGVGLGLLGGFIANKLLTDDQKPKEEVRMESIQPQISTNSLQRTQSGKQQSSQDQAFEQTMLCPIGMEIMSEPMTIPQCGHSFEKKTIYECLKKNPQCPLCRKETSIESLVPNYQLKNIIAHYQATRR